MPTTAVPATGWDEVVLKVLGRAPTDAGEDARQICDALGIRGIGPETARRLLTFGYGLPAAS